MRPGAFSIRDPGVSPLAVFFGGALSIRDPGAPPLAVFFLGGRAFSIRDPGAPPLAGRLARQAGAAGRRGRLVRLLDIYDFFLNVEDCGRLAIHIIFAVRASPPPDFVGRLFYFFSIGDWQIVIGKK